MTVKTDPRPGILSTPRRPPIMSTSPLEITKPIPLPPYRRVVDESSCMKGLNKSAIRPGLIPIPVSRIATSTLEGSSGWGPMTTHTSPLLVNLIAFASRLFRIWRTRVISPFITGLKPGSTRYDKVFPESSAWRAKRSNNPHTTCSRSNVLLSSSIRSA
ncbi:MAG: hypothetical protein BWY82_01118 [Verrucomicrobia bacterium ADurb.Bin474]|nr:MAG: hypothetical protein BWY82_01118 [Verrucomicrobia bacterium ADurb.Bin474]